MHSKIQNLLQNRPNRFLQQYFRLNMSMGTAVGIYKTSTCLNYSKPCRMFSRFFHQNITAARLGCSPGKDEPKSSAKHRELAVSNISKAQISTPISSLNLSQAAAIPLNLSPAVAEHDQQKRSSKHKKAWSIDLIERELASCYGAALFLNFLKAACSGRTPPASRAENLERADCVGD